jgi:hypothetical protein
LILTGTAALLAGCSSNRPSVAMADSFDLDLFGAHVDDLHTPYVAGAQFSITVSSDAAASSRSAWTLSSSDPDVIQVTSPLASGTASVTAGKPGQATLTVLDGSGAVLDSHTVTVAIPTQVNLYAQGLLLTGAADSAAQVTEASILEGGEATFLARYFANGTELFGNGALSSTATDGITTSTASPSFASDRDFLQVTVPARGMSGSVNLVVGGAAVGQLPVTAVATSQVTQVTILQQNSLGVDAGASLVLYAHAVDATSASVFGASFDWVTRQQGGTATPAGSAFGGPSDLFFYTFDATTSEEVTASYAGFTPGTTIHAAGGSVGSTADVGCALAGAPGAGGRLSAVGIGLALAAILASRRRRG